MKAAIRSKYGGPDVLSIAQLPIPVPGKNEVLIKVKVATVNRTDCAILTAKPFIMRLFTGLLKPKLPSTGTDFAGIIEAVGKGVSNFATGDRVWGFHDNGLGSHSEYMVLNVRKPIVKMPEGVSFIDAAASAEGSHYALNFLNKVSIHSDHRVLVNGATGAIGSAMVQLLKKDGVYVTATADTDSIDKIKRIGADRVIDYLKEDFTRDHQEYDFILDTVGKSTFEKCRPIMNKKAVYISSELGPNMQNPILALTTKNKDHRVVFPVPTDIPHSMSTMNTLLEAGKFHPLIDRRYRLDDIKEAFNYVESGEKKGNVIIVMD